MSKKNIESTLPQVATNNVKLIDPIDLAIRNIESNDCKIYFYCPPTNVASGGVSVIFRQARVLKDAGFNTSIIYEPRIDSRASYLGSQKEKKKVAIHEKFNTAWLGKDAEGIEVTAIGDGDIRFNDGTIIRASQLVVNREDFAVIPEGFSNVMEQFSGIHCKKIILAQSWYFILASLDIGQTWQQFGIKDVISVSQGITEYIQTIMSGLNIKNVTQSIDRQVFRKYGTTEKLPKIAFMPGRTQDAVIKTYSVIKAFHCIYPDAQGIRFDELNGLSKTEFAERLGTSALCLYTDEIAGFGTLPLEAMAVGTPVVGWTPLGSKEYVTAENGFWAPNGDVFALARQLGKAVERLRAGELDSPLIHEQHEKTLAKYSPDIERSLLQSAFNEFKRDRIIELRELKK